MERNMSGKTLCKWKKASYEKEIKTFSNAVLPPKYFCAKCGRVASKKKWLCEPTALKI